MYRETTRNISPLNVCAPSLHIPFIISSASCPSFKFRLGLPQDSVLLSVKCMLFVDLDESSPQTLQYRPLKRMENSHLLKLVRIHFRDSYSSSVTGYSVLFKTLVLPLFSSIPFAHNHFQLYSSSTVLFIGSRSLSICLIHVCFGLPRLPFAFFKCSLKLVLLVFFLA